MKKKILPFFLIILLGFTLSDVVWAEEVCESEEECKEKIEKYEEKIDNLQDRGKTLQSEIEYANSQISLTQLKIQSAIVEINNKTQQIEKLAEDIKDLGTRIDKLRGAIEYQENVLGERRRAFYKVDGSTPNDVELILFLISPMELTKKLQKQTYSKVMQDRDNKLIEEMKDTKEAFGKQKDLFEEAKAKEEELRAELEVQKTQLDGYKRSLEEQKASKDRLLRDTQNDEAKYQSLLQEAKEKLESFKAFVESAGGGLIDPDGFGGGDEGWYMSQRDSRWGNKKIGDSSYTIFQSGCLVTSVAMVHKRYGHSVEPDDIAGKDEYFIFGDMRIPWPAPSGKSYNLLAWGYSKSAINSELDKDRPVIVGVRANNQAGTHFLVLAKRDGDDYIMYDPYYGPDLNFSDYYSTGSIFQVVVFK